MPPDQGAEAEGADPALFPFAPAGGTVWLPALLARHPEITNVSAGRFTYYADDDDGRSFLRQNVLYNFPWSTARLDIGPYCAIAHGARFMMADANHVIDGISSFPFPIFTAAFGDSLPLEAMPFPDKGSTRLGPDVWVGRDALILPGACIGAGAIIGAAAVVGGDVPAYGIVAGNPARLVRKRFDDETIAALLALHWWDWPVAQVARAVPLLVRADVPALLDFAAANGLAPG